FAVRGGVKVILDLDPVLFRDRLVFPRQDELSPKVLRMRLEREDGPVYEVYKPDLNSTFVAEAGTDDKMIAKLTGTVSTLFGLACEGYVRLKNVPGDPFAHAPVLTLTV